MTVWSIRFRSIGVALAVIAGIAATSAQPSANGSVGRLTAFQPVDLPVPVGAVRAGVASIAWSGSRWWAVGSFRDSANEHRPGVWSSTDATTWTRISTMAVTPYGEVSELYTVAAPFELYNGPRQISVRTIVDGPSSWVIFGSRDNRNNRVGATSWTSASGSNFVIHDNDAALSSSQSEQTLGADVALQGDQLIAVGEVVQLHPNSTDTDAIVWMSLDGETWKRWTPTGLRLGGKGAQRIQRLSIESERIVMAGTETDLTKTRIVGWTTTNGSTWNQNVIGPFGASDDALTTVTDTVATTTDYFIGARIDEKLRLVTSVSGTRWKELFVSRDLPAGNRTVMSLGANSDSVLVGATGLEGGGLWLAKRR